MVVAWILVMFYRYVKFYYANFLFNYFAAAELLNGKERRIPFIMFDWFPYIFFYFVFVFPLLSLSLPLTQTLVRSFVHFIHDYCFVLFFYVRSFICSDNYWIFLTSRGIGGLAIGTLHFLIPLYINDIVPDDQKPLCHSIMQVQFVLGILSQYILSK